MAITPKESPIHAPLDRRAAADQIAERVRESILRGDIAPGEPLREVELARAFHVTRNTVREALRVLTQNGLTSHEVHRGVAVRRFTVHEVDEVFGVRRIVETAVACRAGTLSAEEIAALVATLEASESAAEQDDFPTVITQNLLFHQKLVSLLGNSRLDRVFDQISAEVTLMLVSLHADVAGPWLGRNRELLRLLVEGRGDDFVSALEHYLASSRDNIIARLASDVAG
jgi:DNA-binding GntR family transcriptional regulator